jgi:hypothetical protein
MRPRIGSHIVSKILGSQGLADGQTWISQSLRPEAARSPKVEAVIDLPVGISESPRTL